MQFILLLVAYFVRFSIACIEKLHHLNKLCAHGTSVTFPLFAAKCTLKQLYDKFLEHVKEVAADAPTRDAPDCSDATDFSKLKRSLSAFEAECFLRSVVRFCQARIN